MTTRRTTRTNDEEQSDEIKVILNGISQKLEYINESLQKLFQTQQNDRETTTAAYEILAASIQTMEHNVSAAINKSATAFRKEEILNQRQSVIGIWKRELNKRKQLYWNSLNCENTSIIYETWIHKEKKVIPKKFLMRVIPNEDPREKRIRQHAVISETQAEINLLKIRAERHHTNYKKIDEEMANVLETNFEGEIVVELRNLWVEECKVEEAKSHRKWETKQIWLGKYEEEFKSDDFIKPRNERITDQRNREITYHQQAPTRSINQFQKRKSSTSTSTRHPASGYERRHRQNERIQRTEKPNRNTSGQSQGGNRNYTAPRFEERRTHSFPDRRPTERKQHQQRKPRNIYYNRTPTYAEVVRRPYRERREQLEQRPTAAYNNRGQDHFLESTQGGNYPPIYQQHPLRHQRPDRRHLIN